MPNYRYQCQTCTAIIEIVHGVTSLKPNCPECEGILKIKWDQVATFPDRYSPMAPRVGRGRGNTGVSVQITCAGIPINEHHFWSKVNQGSIEDCWPFTDAISKTTQYGHYHIGRRPNRVTRGAHRVAYALSEGRWPDNMVLHKCHYRRCCNPSHLYMGSHQDNMNDMISSGRSKRGITNAKNKLTEQHIQQIRKSSKTNAALASKFGVTPPTISSIKTGRIWGWFEPDKIPHKAATWGKSRFKGVKLTRSQAWGAYAYMNGQQVWIGSFATEREAAKQRDAYVRANNLDVSLNFE